MEESFGKINAKDVELFQNGSVHEFYHSKALITLEEVNTSVIKIKKDLYEQNFNGEANRSGVTNFCCMQMSLVMSMRFIFSNDQSDAPCSSHFCSFSFESRPLH